MATIEILRTGEQRTWIESPACQDSFEFVERGGDILYTQEPENFLTVLKTERRPVIVHLDTITQANRIPDRDNLFAVTFSKRLAEEAGCFYLTGGMWGMDHTKHGLILGAYKRRYDYTYHRSKTVLVIYDGSLTSTLSIPLGKIIEDLKWQAIGVCLDGKVCQDPFLVDRTEDPLVKNFNKAGIVVFVSRFARYPRAVGQSIYHALPVIALQNHFLRGVSSALPTFENSAQMQNLLKPLLHQIGARRKLGEELYFEAARKNREHRADYRDFLKFVSET